MEAYEALAFTKEITQPENPAHDVRHKSPYDCSHQQVWFWEPQTAAGVLTQDGVTQIAFHKYKPGSYTFLDLKLNPVWEWLTSWLPMWLAPNMVTTIGGLHCCLGYILSQLYHDPVAKTTPDWVMIFNGYCIIVYYTLDCMDGKQARRTKTSSPLGQLFDHGADCLCTLFHISTLSAWVEPEPTTLFFIQSSLSFCFFMAQWEEYYTGVLPHASGNIGCTEVNYGMGLLSIANAFIDRSAIYGRIIPLPFLGDRELRFVLGSCWLFFSFFLMAMSLARTYPSIPKDERVSAFSKFLSPLMLALVPVWFVDNSIPFLSLGLGLAFCQITIKLIVLSMARMAYAAIQLDAVVCVAICLWVTLDSRLTPLGAELALKTMCIGYGVRMLWWTHAAVTQLCTRLDIYLFTIKKH